MSSLHVTIRTIAKLQIDLAAELKTWTAKFEAWQASGSIPSLRPRGKEGNCITRMYKKTGWWPLKKNSVLWQQAIETLGPLYAPTKHKLSDKAHKFADVGDKRIRIRQPSVGVFWMCPFRRVLLYTLYVVFCALYEMQPIPFFDSPT